LKIKWKRKLKTKMKKKQEKMNTRDFLIIAFIVFVFYWLIKLIYIFALFVYAILESIATKIKIRKIQKENEDVLDKLLRNKIGKDCVGVVKSYLHENDYEFVKAAFCPEYKPNIEFSILRTYESAFYQRESAADASEYEILENFRWYRAKYSRVKGIDYESIEIIISGLVKRNYQKCILYILQNFPIDSRKIFNAVIMQDKINLLKSIINEFPHLNFRIKFGEALGASKNDIVDYLHFDLKIPLPNDIYEKAIYENTYNGKNLIRKLNWIYSVGVKPTYHVFRYACKQNGYHNTEKVITWLLDHNCPTKALRA